MTRRKPIEDPVPLPPPATTLEGRNDQLIALAFNLAERRLSEGTASAQEVVHFLKAGSANARLEQEKLRNENLVLETRVKEMEARRNSDDVYSKALAAFRGYSGTGPILEDEDEEEILF